MLNPAHILELALLLLVAFLIGATVGSLIRLLALRLTRSGAVAAPEVVVAPIVVAATDSLVTAPVIEPLVKPSAPVAPAEVPAMDFTEALVALAGEKPASLAPIKIPSITPPAAVEQHKPPVEMAPARVAGATTSGRPIERPRIAPEPALATFVAGPSADVIPFPVERAPVEGDDQPVMNVVVEQRLQVVESDQKEPSATVEAVAKAGVEEPVEADAESPAEDTTATSQPPALEPAAVVAVIDEPVVEAIAVVEPPAVSLSAVTKSSDEGDEAAAMRAIEGNWSPRRGTPGRARKVALPEGEADDAVAASAAAVASAALAVSDAVAAGPDVAPGKPVGLDAPRHGAKDDLTHVIGILPIIETALNRLGLYHFDQIAELTDENADWIEAHLGIAGRISREHWREQARELASAMAGTRKAAAKH